MSLLGLSAHLEYLGLTPAQRQAEAARKKAEADARQATQRAEQQARQAAQRQEQQARQDAQRAAQQAKQADRRDDVAARRAAQQAQQDKAKADRDAAAAQRKADVDARRDLRRPDIIQVEAPASDGGVAPLTLTPAQKRAANVATRKAEQDLKKQERKDAQALKKDERLMTQQERKDAQALKQQERKDAQAQKKDERLMTQQERKEAQALKKEERLMTQQEKKDAAAALKEQKRLEREGGGVVGSGGAPFDPNLIPGGSTGSSGAAPYGFDPFTGQPLYAPLQQNPFPAPGQFPQAPFDPYGGQYPQFPPQQYQPPYDPYGGQFQQPLPPPPGYGQPSFGGGSGGGPLGPLPTDFESGGGPDNFLPSDFVPFTPGGAAPAQMFQTPSMPGGFDPGVEGEVSEDEVSGTDYGGEAPEEETQGNDDELAAGGLFGLSADSDEPILSRAKAIRDLAFSTLDQIDERKRREAALKRVDSLSACPTILIVGGIVVAGALLFKAFKKRKR